MTHPGNAVALPNAGYADGLEDLDSSDLTIPRLRIDHKQGVLKDGQTGQEFPEVFAVIFGLVKQRILWHPSIENDEKPMCKSPDFLSGYPNLHPTKPNKAFPFSTAGFDPNSAPANGGLLQLPCEGCKLKEWGSHPMGDKPYCSEQHTLPMLYAESLDALRAGMHSPALFTVQKSGLKPSKNYLSPFAQRKRPVYSVMTRISLKQLSAGSNPYAIPVFSTIGETNTDDWMEYSERFAAMKMFLQNSRPRGDEEPQSMTTQAYVPPTVQAPPTVQSGGYQAPTVQAPPSMPLPQMPVSVGAPAPAAPVAADDDDLPF